MTRVQDRLIGRCAGLMLIFILATGMFLFAEVRAEEFPDPTRLITLSEVLDSAKINSPVLVAQSRNLQASESRVWSAWAGLLPSVTAGGSYSRNWSNLSVSSVDTVLSRNNYSASLNGSLTLFNLGEWAAVSRQLASRDQVAAVYRQTERDLSYNVSQAYLTVQLRQANLIVADTAYEIARVHLDQATTLNTIGRAPQLDLFRAKSSLSSAEADRVTAQTAFESAWQDLGRAIGIPIRQVSRVTPLDVPVGITEPPASSTDSVARNRPEWKAAEAAERQSSASLTSAWSQLTPSLSASGRYGYSGSEFPLKDGWSVGASLSWNIFDSWATPSNIAAAKADLESRQASNKDVYLGLRQEIEKSRLTLSGAIRKMTAAQDAVTYSREAYRLAEGRYSNGAGSAIELEDARLTFLNNRYALAAAINELAAAQLTWDRVTLSWSPESRP